MDKFLATNETTFAIPIYHRNYDWTLTTTTIKNRSQMDKVQSVYGLVVLPPLSFQRNKLSSKDRFNFGTETIATLFELKRNY